MLLTAIKRREKDKVALQTANRSISYGELAELVVQFGQWLKDNTVQSVALYCDNTPEWVVVDLACQHAGVVFTAVPLFFSPAQLQHQLKTAQPDLLLSDAEMAVGRQTDMPLLQLHAYRLATQERALLPPSTSKITYTSGSTGEPKGVCLSITNQLTVAQSLFDVTGLSSPKHLCLLPLSTLLENIAGIYSPLLAGGSVYLADDQQRGFSGSRLTDPKQLFACIDKAQPNSLILVPELLQVLLQGAKSGWTMPKSLRFIAVGGSKVTQSLLDSAHKLGFPVYQGYGLSECASVVSLQTPGSATKGAGKILPHLSARVSDGQLVVYGNSFLGYLNEPDSWGSDCVYTGDIAELKNDEVIINGRLKNLIINSFGRNISPEWVEAEMLATGLFRQFVLFGDSRPYCVALFVPLSPQIEPKQLMQAISSVNQSLPDYAQVKNYMRLERMGYEEGLLTANGRPKRQAIFQRYRQQIEQLYTNKESNNEFISASVN